MNILRETSILLEELKKNKMVNKLLTTIAVLGTVGIMGCMEITERPNANPQYNNDPSPTEVYEAYKNQVEGKLWKTAPNYYYNEENKTLRIEGVGDMDGDGLPDATHTDMHFTIDNINKEEAEKYIHPEF